MSDDRTVELIYFEGCPNVDAAREHLARALEAEGLSAAWTEWDVDDAETPEEKRAFGSPTVLVDGVDVTGASEPVAFQACRADGAPEVKEIVHGLRVSG